MNIQILRFDSLESTNTEAAQQARRGAPEGTCVIAREQTAGRGRHGRSWISTKDAGLYFSIILRPPLDAQKMPLITLMAGVAAYDTLREIGLRPDIKWVNDLLVRERKIGGILAETVDTPTGLAVIVGVGINLRSSSFDGEIGQSATSIEAESGVKLTQDHVAEILTRYLEYFYDILSQTDGGARILREWQTRSSYFSGRDVRVALAAGSIDGTTDGLEGNGALRVKTADGSVTIVQAGDVMRLRSN